VEKEGLVVNRLLLGLGVCLAGALAFGVPTAEEFAAPKQEHRLLDGHLIVGAVARPSGGS